MTATEPLQAVPAPIVRPASRAAAVGAVGAAGSVGAVGSVGRSSMVLSAASGLVGVLSYACALVMAHLLPVQQYGTFAAAQTVLLIVGTVASSLVPLPLAHQVRATPPGSPGRRAAVSFAVQTAAVTGLVAAVATGVTALGFADVPVALAIAVSALLIAGIAPVWGWLQGEGRFGRYAAATVVEVGLRFVVSVGVVLAGWGVGGAVAGFAAGALVVVLCGPWWLRRDLAWDPRALADRGRWRETADIALVQLVTSVLVGADVLVIAYSGDHSAGAAGFQALSTLAKGPVYIATGTVLVLFPLLRAGGPDARPALHRGLATYGRIAVVAAAVLATVPAGVAGLVLPAEYLRALPEAPWLATAGLGYGLVMVLVIALLALREIARCRIALAVAALVLPTAMLVGHGTAGVHGLAVGTAVGALVAGGAAVIAAGPLLPGISAPRALAAVGATALVMVVLALLRAQPVAWAAGVAVLAGALLLALRGRRSDPEDVVAPREPGRLRLLHLGFEDPAMPGSGGGALRTHETGRRIARRHDLTVLVQRYPGCVDRVQDGVRYEHVGLGRGRTRLGRVVGYMACLPRAVRGRPADLVIEDFFAPVSTIGAPLWTGRPTVGLVQWLNAREKAAQFKVPVHLVERFGVRRHTRLLAVSAGLRERLLAVNPALDVTVVGNGVDATAFTVSPRDGRDVVFVGRLEIAQKGIDLLLAAWASACRRIPGDLVLAGTGPDEQRIRALAENLGVADRVVLAGWVSGRAKFELMASARVVVVPSRFETFGIVAIEAAATGTPVVAFDIDCLREVVPGFCGVRVPAFDVAAYADAIVAVHEDVETTRRGVDARRAFARRFDWDAVAAEQERFLVDSVAGPRAVRA